MLLARSGAGLYWLSRYLARAEHLSRLLWLQTEALVDRPVRDIHFGWTRIYACIGRQPPWGELERLDDDDYLLADSFTLTGDLAFEPANPSSVRSCFTLGRDYARQMRQHISAEMWTRLNLAYLRIRDLSIEEIWRISPERFFAETEASIDTFMGVAAATMYRGDGWRFIQLGNMRERIQLLSDPLLSQQAALEGVGDSTDSDWISLLRQYHALAAYNQRFGVRIVPGQIHELLITDPLLPGSMRRSLDSAAAQLGSLGAAPDQECSAAAKDALFELNAVAATACSGGSDRGGRLRRIEKLGRDLHDRINAAFFEYAVETAPRS